jgi:hypothetical protein
MLRLVQLETARGRIVAALGSDGTAQRIQGVGSTYELAMLALGAAEPLSEAAAKRLSGEEVDLGAAEAEGRLLPPIDHPDPAHLYLTGTGLTHLGSADSRAEMHQKAAAGAVTDSMRMFLMGVEGGKPASGQQGVQPEWFYKGDGSCLVPPGAVLESPSFALDGSEEPEIAGIYIIDAEGRPCRLGFAVGNEFSDHRTEAGNYLWLAHSKLRPAALGAELLTGTLPAEIRGTSRIVREGETLWEKPFLSGEAHMSHSIANLEHHHFKYSQFRRPGDVHVHFFGTATLSFADGVVTRAGDVFEIAAEPFLIPLRNRLGQGEAVSPAVRVL